MAFQIKENRQALEQFLRSREVQEALKRIAEQCKQRAEQLTPVDTGRMKSSWLTEVTVENGHAHARVLNTARSPEGAPYPLYVEKGTSRMRAQHVLSRAIDSVRSTN